MSKLIKHARELPPEFSLRKYRNLKGMTVGEWAALINHRKHLKRQIDQLTKCNTDRDVRILDGVRQAVDQLISDPLRTIASTAEVDEDVEHGLVRESTVFDLISRTTHPSSKPNIEAYSKYLSGPDSLGNADRNLLRSVAARVTPTLADIVVDLAAPEECILNDFIMWLKSAKAKLAQPSPYSLDNGKSFSQERLRRLANTQAIPYIDLNLWASANQLRISATLLAEVLTSHSAGAVSIYKTTETWAKRLLDDVTVAALCGEASARP